MTIAKIKVNLLNLSKEVWPRITIFALLAALTAVGAMIVRHYFPLESHTDKISVETVSNILNILASSMLAVTTFSLTTMVTAYGAATSVSPRATKLVMQDNTTKNVLSTFLGSFIFSLVGLILINLGLYEGNGRFILFIMTLAVIALIVITLIRWIDRLGKLGRVGETIKMVEDTAEEAMKKRAAKPYLGGRPLVDKSLAEAAPYSIKAGKYGYIQYFEAKELSSLAEKNDLEIFILLLPGTYVAPSTELMRYKSNRPFDQPDKLAEAIIVGDEREYEQDPRFGLCVLAEIGDKALPPAVNDSGTIIDVIGRLVRVLDIMVSGREGTDPEIEYPRLWIPPIDVGDLFEDCFNSLTRDGAGLYEVQCRLQKAFRALYQTDDSEFRRWAKNYSLKALARAEKSGNYLPEEITELRRLSLK